MDDSQDKTYLAQMKHSQLAFTCSKSTIETVEKDAKYVQI